MRLTTRLLTPALVLSALIMSTFLVACGDEAAPPAPRYAPIVVFNGVADLAPGTVTFKIGETTIAGNAAYGVPTPVAQALVGSATEVKALNAAGVEIGKATVAIDSNKSIWVIASGLALTQQAAVFGVSAAEPSVPAGSVLLRAIHASSNAPKVDVRQNNALGAKLATGIEYKRAGDFTSVDTSVRVLSITRTDTGAELMQVDVAGALTPGKIYNLVIFGSTAADSTAAGRLQAKVVVEP